MKYKANQEMSDDVAIKLLDFFKDLSDNLDALDEQEHIILDVDIDSFFALIVDSYHIPRCNENYEYLMSVLFDLIQKNGEKFSIEFIKYLKTFDGLKNQ